MAESPSSNSSLSSPTSPGVDPAARAAAVWAGIGQIFGRRFAAEFGEKPSAYWVREIAELTDAQLSTGLGKLRSEARQHPPSLGEFVAACKASGSPRMLGQDLDDDTVERLAGPPAPGRFGLPSGMSAIAYKAAEVKASGMLPYIDGRYTCASSLPPKFHAQYFAGRYENAQHHRDYLRRNPGYRAQLEREFAFKWNVQANLDPDAEARAA